MCIYILYIYIYAHIQSGILLSHKKWNLAICSNMDGLGGHYAKWIKSEKDKYCMISLMYEILKIQQTSEYNKKETDSQI